MSRPKKRGADVEEIEEVEEVASLSQETDGLVGAIGKMALRSNSGCSLGSRHNSSSSVKAVVEKKRNDGSDKIDGLLGDGSNIATVSILFDDNCHERFSTQNTQFCFNPQNDLQREEIKAKLSKIKVEARKLNVSYNVLVLSGITTLRTITKIGGLSASYASKRFPPTPGTASWLKNAERKPRKQRAVKKPKTFGLGE